MVVIDQFTREALAIEVDHSIPSQRVIRVLDRLIELRGCPKAITSDDGSESTSLVMETWAQKNVIKLDFIWPGKPIENAHAESFIGRFRDECLNENVFAPLNDDRGKIQFLREDYNCK